MAHGGGGNSEGVEVNLIPMIDIVIQLITFFLMLVNFDDANVDERIRLPVADLAKPSEMEIDEPLVLNVNGSGQVSLGLGGDVVFDGGSEAFRQQMAREARTAERNMKRAKREVKRMDGRPQLWTTILIRADAGVQTGMIQSIMKTCQGLGFHKFALRATPEPRPM